MNVALAPPVMRQKKTAEKKCQFSAEIQLHSALIPEFATRRVLSEYHSHIPGSFLELDGVSGSVSYSIRYCESSLLNLSEKRC